MAVRSKQDEIDQSGRLPRNEVRHRLPVVAFDKSLAALPVSDPVRPSAFATWLFLLLYLERPQPTVDIEGCAQRVEIMLAGRGVLMQAEETVGEFLAVARQESYRC